MDLSLSLTHFWIVVGRRMNSGARAKNSGYASLTVAVSPHTDIIVWVKAGGFREKIKTLKKNAQFYVRACVLIRKSAYNHAWV